MIPLVKLLTSSTIDSKYTHLTFISSNENRNLFNNGLEVYINWAQKKDDRKRNYEGAISDRYIVVQGLKNEVDEEKLREVIRQYGEVNTVQIFPRLS